MRAERDAVLADQCRAVDVSRPLGKGSGEAATYLAAAEDEIEAHGLGVLVDDHLATPFAPAERIGAGIVEEAVASHDAASQKHDDAGRVTLLGAAHVDPERVEAVDHSGLGG